MTITELLKNIASQSLTPTIEDFEVRGLAVNSKGVFDDFVFVAVKGEKADGARFIREAVERGARAVIAEEKTEASVPVITVADSRKALAHLAAAFYGNPSGRMRSVGITGTNGKTTTTFIIEAFLNEACRAPGVIGTINYRYKDKVIPAANTTPGPLDLQRILNDMAAAGVEYAVMEVSSHALDQDRVTGVDFSSAVFTNLTQDHLDYHKTIEHYFRSKAKLFERLGGNAFAVINNDDHYGRQLKDITKAPVITYGLNEKSDVCARDVVSNRTGTAFLVETPSGIDIVRTRLIGAHNIYNILGAVAWGVREGLPLSVMMAAMERFKHVPGRLERVLSHAPFSVFVDYAHTEDALRNCIQSLRPLTDNRIIVVFGCGGERDRGKRPKMGNTATCFADISVITNDNPRSESPDGIIDEICSGIVTENFKVVPDRREAIRTALSLAQTGDIVLVAGKGHETSQILQGSTLHFDDREEIRACLQSMNY